MDKLKIEANTGAKAPHKKVCGTLQDENPRLWSCMKLRDTEDQDVLEGSFSEDAGIWYRYYPSENPVRHDQVVS